MKNLILILGLLVVFADTKAQTDVVFYTSKGRFVVEIYDNVVPITGGNFLDLADSNFYDGVIFHRVINNFMIQGGDPTGTGSGGPGYTIPDEFDPSLSNVQKTISMANAGPNTGGSQFFINLVDNTYLDYDKAPTTSKHAVFGMTTQNFNIVQDIGLVPTNAQDRPLTDVVIDSIRRGSDLTVGLDNLNPISFSARIYPNPGNQNSLIDVSMKESGNVTVQIYDSMGRLIITRSKNLQEGRNLFHLSDVLNQELNAGVYHILLIDENNSEELRLFVN